jgi:hypothetical protein
MRNDGRLRHEDKLSCALEPDVSFERGEHRGAVGTGADAEGHLLEADDLSGLDDFGGLVFGRLVADAHVVLHVYGRGCRSNGGPTHAHVRIGAGGAKASTTVSQRDTFVHMGDGDEGKECQRDGSHVAVTVGVVEGYGETGPWFLFGSLFKIDDVTHDHRSSAKVTGGLIPVDACFGEDRGARGELAGIQGGEEFDLNGRLRGDRKVLVSTRTLSGGWHGEGESDAEKEQSPADHGRSLTVASDWFQCVEV